jgi:hypothetical protein
MGNFSFLKRPEMRSSSASSLWAQTSTTRGLPAPEASVCGGGGGGDMLYRTSGLQGGNLSCDRCVGDQILYVQMMINCDPKPTLNAGRYLNLIIHRRFFN